MPKYTKNQFKKKLIKLIDDNIDNLPRDIMIAVMSLRAQIDIKLKD